MKGATTLVWTNPTENALVVDTTNFECSGGPVLADLDSVLIFYWPNTGGMARQINAISARFREGLVDSCTITEEGWYHAIAIDTLRNPGCPSNRVYIGTTTDVPISEWDQVKDIRWFNVRGQYIGKNLTGWEAAGIYLRRTMYRSGRVTVTKRTIVK